MLVQLYNSILMLYQVMMDVKTKMGLEVLQSNHLKGLVDSV